MSKASRANKNDLKAYNLHLKVVHLKQVQRKEMTLKHYKELHRWWEKEERMIKKERLDFFSLPIVQLTIRRGKNEQKFKNL